MLRSTCSSLVPARPADRSFVFRASGPTVLFPLPVGVARRSPSVAIATAELHVRRARLAVETPRGRFDLHCEPARLAQAVEITGRNHRDAECQWLPPVNLNLKGVGARLVHPGAPAPLRCPARYARCSPRALRAIRGPQCAHGWFDALFGRWPPERRSFKLPLAP